MDVELRIGEHFAYLYQHAAEMSHPDRPLHLCFLDRLRLLWKVSTELIPGRCRLSYDSDIPLIFQRSQLAWGTHPQNYRDIEGMVTTVGHSFLAGNSTMPGATSPFGAGQLREIMPLVKNPDLSMVAE